METIHRDQPLATDTFTLGLSFKLTLVNVSSNGARTNTDGLRGHVGRHPSRFLGQVRIICPRMSACMALSHQENTRLLRLGPKAFTAGFSGHDPHRMMHICGLDGRPV